MPLKDDAFKVLSFLFGFFVLSLFWLVNRSDRLVAQHRITCFFLSAGMAFSLLFGFCLEEHGDLRFLFAGGTQTIKTTMVFVALLCFSYLLISLLFGCWEFCFQNSPNSKKPVQGNLASLFTFVQCFERHMFGFSFVVLAVGWTPFLLGSFPGLFMGDTGGQISQWFNLSSYTSNYLPLLSQNVLLNQHHPVLHTAIMGSFVQLGMTLFNSANLGYFMYTAMQYVVFVASISYALHCAHRLGAHALGLLLALCFFLLNPIFPQFAVTGTKDTLFTCSILVMMANALLILGDAGLRPSIYVGFFLSSFFTAFLRNGSIVAVVALCCLLLLVTKRKRFLFVNVSVIVCLYLVITNVVFPALSITPTGKRETLSIPIQQVSRCVEEHDAEIPDSVKRQIDIAIDYQTALTRYNPSMADSVKNTFDEKHSERAFEALISSWEWMLTHYPSTCIEATMANYYGYFYPSRHITASRFSSWSREFISRNHNDFFKFRQGNSSAQDVFGGLISSYSDAWQAFPVLSLLTSSALYSWWLILLVCYTFFYCVKSMRIVFIVPVFLLLVNLIGPANGSIYIRYMFPIMCMLPMLHAIIATSGAMLRRR